MPKHSKQKNSWGLKKKMPSDSLSPKGVLVSIVCSKSAKWLNIIMTRSKSAKWLILIMTCSKSAKCVCVLFFIVKITIKYT